MIVKLRRKNSHYSDLSPRQNYVVIGIEASDLRILNDRGRPFLYPARLFEVLDSHEPNNWITEFGDDGERYAYPPALNGSGFFEDFFDDKKPAVVAFWQVVNQHLAAAITAQSSHKKTLPRTRIGIETRSAQHATI